MQHEYGVVLVVEAILAFLFYPTPELWRSREAGATAKAQPGAVPLQARLWRLVAVTALVSYTAAVATRGTGFLELPSGPHARTPDLAQRFLLGVIFGVPYFYAVAVVLGAPLAEGVDATLAVAVLLALLIAGPLATAAFEMRELRLPPIYKGPPGESAVVRWRAMGCALGAWLGATLVPLDWAMPFQEYPLPLVAGAILGHNLGALGCYVHERWSRPKRRIRFA